MPVEQASITGADFEYVRSIAKSKAAIVLESDKQYLVESRLSPLAEEEGFESLQALIAALRKADVSSKLHSRAIDALTTNETLFFRDLHPFDALRDHIIPELIAARKDRKYLNIWSAASSTGQEAYSVAMLLKDSFPELRSWKVSIVGTDISETAVKQARAGSYGQHEISRGLPAALLMRHFTQVADRWTIKAGLRNMVDFQNMNLVGSWPQMPVFDLILIRNVLIYFDNESRRKILHRLVRQLAPDGYMAMGSAETPKLITDAFRPVTVGRATFYRLSA